MPPKFIYFDLGNVLLHFDHHLAARQMADVAGVDTQRVWDVVFAGDLEERFERGDLTVRQFYEEFCAATDARPDYAALVHAGSAIFTANYSIVPVVAALAAAGFPLGVLSNTNACHWEYCLGRFAGLSRLLDVHVLSYEIGAVKPDEKIFQAAIGRAGTPPGEIFFTDDVAGHVEAARAAGLDAVQFTSVAELVRQLRSRGVRMNY